MGKLLDNNEAQEAIRYVLNFVLQSIYFFLWIRVMEADIFVAH